MQYFFMQLSDDKGKFYLKTAATNQKAAIQKVMNAEGCPESAIEIREVFKYEYDTLKPFDAFNPSGIFKMLVGLVNCEYGAPMGRTDKGTPNGKIYDRKVPINSGGYDRGGAYWGIGGELRVKYNNLLTYWEFYRK